MFSCRRTYFFKETSVICHLPLQMMAKIVKGNKLFKNPYSSFALMKMLYYYAESLYTNLSLLNP